jgi:Zn finger protein HypA/HybF involved in hydrogenase expression
MGDKKRSSKRKKRHHYKSYKRQRTSLQSSIVLPETVSNERNLNNLSSDSFEYEDFIDNKNDPEYTPAKTIKSIFEKCSNKNIIINSQILVDSLKGILKCNKCRNSLDLFELTNSRVGLSSTYSWYCAKCRVSKKEFNNSAMVDNVEEVNFRLFYSLRCLGHGDYGCKTLCSLMNLDKPRSRSEKYNDPALIGN